MTSVVPFDLNRALQAIAELDPLRVTGRVRALVGLAVHATVPGVRAGEVVEIVRRSGPPLEAEVVGFELERATLLPLGDARGIGPDDPVRPTGRPLSIQVS